MLSPSEELPAAHSMDTEWFAIDSQGNVAVFDSGEGGGVPEDHFGAWHAQSMWSDLLGELVRLAPPGGLPFAADGVFDSLEGRYEVGELYTSIDAIDTSYPWEIDALLELDGRREDGVIEGLLGSGRMLGCRASLAYVPTCIPATLVGAWHELGVVRAILRPPLGPERFGVYSYECQDYSGGPYRRIAKPLGSPLRVESLATDLRRRLARVRLGNADFGADSAIQPFEHVSSTIWGSTWIGTDGSVHEVE